MIPERAWFQAYLDAFNANDFDGFGAYYAPDVAFFRQAATLEGRDAVLAFYDIADGRFTRIRSARFRRIDPARP